MNNSEHLTLRLARLKPSEQFEQKRDTLTFVFSKGGWGKFTFQKTTHRLAAGDILVFNGGPDCSLTAFGDSGEYLFWTFFVCFENLLPLFSSAEISLLHKLNEGYKAGKMYPASTPLAAECHRLLTMVPSQFNLDHRGQILRIAASILSTEFREGMSERSGQFSPEDNMVQVFEKLSASELINLSVGELASRFSCSRRHLNRLFHRHFGVSVAALRMEMRLLKAVSLLRDANAKVINVAEECGFNHLGLFNTCFKRRFGMSPGLWRKSAIKAEAAPVRKIEPNKMACPLHSVGLCPLGNGSLEAGVPLGAAVLPDKKKGGDEARRRNMILGMPPLPEAGRAISEGRPGL